MRTYPIRVPGRSGPFGTNELSWDEITRRSGSREAIIEYTTVTKKPRRIAEFDLELVKRSAEVNSATMIALHGADYIDISNRVARTYDELTGETRDFIERIEAATDVPVSLVGVGPRTEMTIDRRRARPAAASCSVRRRRVGCQQRAFSLWGAMTLVVVLSGPIAAGKTTLAWQLRDAYGAVVFGTRQLLLAHLGPGAGRANLQRLGETLDRETSGMWVADALNVELVQRGDVPIIVVDACRVREQVDAIRSAFPRVITFT